MKTYKHINSETGEEIVINIKDSWEEVSLTQYLKYYNLIMLKDNYISDLIFNIDIAVTVSDVDSSVFYKINQNMLDNILMDLQWLTVLPTGLYKGKFEYKGITFVTIPKIKYDTDVSLGEKVQIDAMMKADPDNAMLHPLVVLIRPGKEVIDPITNNKKWVRNELDPEYFDITREMLEHQSAADLVAVSNFFLTGQQVSTKGTKATSTRKKGQVK